PDGEVQPADRQLRPVPLTQVLYLDHHVFPAIGGAGNPRHATHARNHPPGPASATRPQAGQPAYAARPTRPPPTDYQPRPGAAGGQHKGDPPPASAPPSARPRKRPAQRGLSASPYGAGDLTAAAPRTRRPPPEGQFYDWAPACHVGQAESAAAGSAKRSWVSGGRVRDHPQRPNLPRDQGYRRVMVRSVTEYA